MNDKASPRQLIMTLQPDQGSAMYDPNQPTKRICQVYRSGNTYYVVGPHFYHYTCVQLEVLFKLSRRDGMSAAQAVGLLTETLRTKGVPPEAHVFTCSSQVDALDTLAGLFAAYSLR